MASVTASSPTTEDYSYYDRDFTDPPYIRPTPRCIEQPWCVTHVVIDVILSLLGVVGNGLVIWVISFKMRQKETVTSTWYLSLAVSDLLYCATLPLVRAGSWTFGLFMCKFASFFKSLNMFSSVLLMVLISMDRCVSVVFPIWARNNRTLRRARLAVVVAWLLAIVVSAPYLVVGRNSTIADQGYNATICYKDHELLPGSSTGVPVSRFVLGFVFPLLVITVCYSVIAVRLQSKRTARSASARPLKIMTAVIVTFVLCWLPYHVFLLADINNSNYSYNTFIARQMLLALVSASSCVNPFLYAFMGKDVKQKLSSLFSRIENAFNEKSKESVSTDAVQQN